MHFQASFILSAGLLLLRAGATHVSGFSRAINIRADETPAAATYNINCDLLKGGLSCSGLNRAKCALRGWEKAVRFIHTLSTEAKG